MDSTEMSLFGTEYSLFSGDLLGFPSSVLTEDEVVIEPQDGLKSTTDQPATWQVEDVALGQALNSTNFNADPLEDWLDTRIDLLDLLANVEIIPSEADNAQTSSIPIIPSGLDAVKSVALETTLQLSAEVQKDSSVGKISGTEENPYSTGLGLIDLLASTMATFDEPVTQSIDLNVAQDSSILSPMSPEDVESILSSGPASPVSQEESIEMLFETMSASDSSFELEQSLLVENNIADNIPADLARLSQMVSSENQILSVNDNSLDSSIESGNSTMSEADEQEEYHVNKSRKTPYTRGTKKDKKTQQDKQLERKLRKKQQNKDAATRYRQKKKAEADRIDQDAGELEEKNAKLRERVEQMTNEVQYLKNLLADVYKARGMKCK